MIAAVRILFTIQIALILAAIIGAIAPFIAYFVATAMGAEDINGGLAMGVFTTVAPIGAIVGLVLGVIAAMWIVRRASDRAIATVATILLVMSVAIPSTYFLIEELNDGDPYDLEKPRPVVHLEIRLPQKIPDGTADRLFRKSLISYGSSTWVTWEDPRQRDEAGTTILRARVKLYYRVANRKLQFWRAGEKTRMVFDLKLPREPQPSDVFGAWLPVDTMIDPDSGQQQPAEPDPGFHVRWRVSME